jgi:hypothetical protein
MFGRLTTQFRGLHREERGLEALQVVLIIAIAAMLLIGVSAVVEKANQWMGVEAGMIIGADDARLNPEGTISTFRENDAE